MKSYPFYHHLAQWLLIELLALLVFVSSGCAARKRAKPTPPNIIVIVADDMGYTDLSCYGQPRWHTPYLDAFAQTGIRFTRAYASASVCTPSRCGLLTGAYPYRNGLGGDALWFNAQRGLSSEVSTLPATLHAAGYRTGCFGKWHLGHLPKYMPPAHHFDEFQGIPYSHSMWTLRDDGSTAKFPPLPVYDGTNQVDVIDSRDKMEHLTERFTDGACEFIMRSAEADKPFFLYLAYPMPHVPLGCTKPFQGKSGAGLYGDVITELDANVGRLLQTLEQNQLREKTIVIFTSDNGPWLNYGDHAGTCIGLREGKGTSFEGGFRVPLIISYPAALPQNKVEPGIVSHLDFLPTLLDYAHVPLPNTQLDGVNQRAFWEGTTSMNPRRAFNYYFNQQRQASLDAEKDLKTIYPHHYQSYTLGCPANGGKAGTRVRTQAPAAIYNLTCDPGETTDCTP